MVWINDIYIYIFLSQSLYLICFLYFTITTTKGSNLNAAPFDSIARALDLNTKFRQHYVFKGTYQKRVFETMPKIESVTPSLSFTDSLKEPLLFYALSQVLKLHGGSLVGVSPEAGEQGKGLWQWLNKTIRTRRGCGLCGWRGRDGFWVSPILSYQTLFNQEPGISLPSLSSQLNGGDSAFMYISATGILIYLSS